MRLTLFCFFLVFFFCLPISAQNLLPNPGFEEIRENGSVVGWNISDKDGACSVDISVSHSGQHSLRFQNIKTYAACTKGFGALAEFKDDYRLSGWVKYENLRDGAVDFKVYRMPFLGIWTNHKNGGNSLTFNALELSPGDSDWQYFEKIFTADEMQARIEQLSHDKRPASWSVRINISNQIGAIWFDDLQFVKVPQEALLVASLDSSAYIAGRANAYLNLALQGVEGKTATVLFTLSNADGKELLRDKAEASSLLRKVAVPIGNIPAGNYQLTLVPEDSPIKPVTLSFSLAEDPFADDPFAEE